MPSALGSLPISSPLPMTVSSFSTVSYSSVVALSLGESYDGIECRASSAALTLHDSVAHGAAQALWLTRELKQKSPESVSAEELALIAQACEAVVHDARQVMTSLMDNQFEIQTLTSKKQPAGTNLHNSRGSADELPPLPSRAKTWLSEF